MRSLLEQYGTAIFTLVFIAILIAMAGPFGVKIKEYMLEKTNYTNQIGSEEIAKATNNENKSEDIATMNELYACLYTNGELVISAAPIDNTGRTDVDTDFEECVLKDVVKNDIDTYPKWLSPYLAEMYGSRYVDTHTENIKTVNIINEIKPTTCEYWFYSCTNLTEIKNIQNLNTSECTDMQYMFCGCQILSNLDVSKWDTSKVTNMIGMLISCSPQNILKGYDLSEVSENPVDTIQYLIDNHIFNLDSIDMKNKDFYLNIFNLPM